jgi:hypothetical protein
MKVGDIVRSIIPTYPRLNDQDTEEAGIILQWNGHCGVMVLWEHGGVCYSPLDELELVSEN